MAVNLLIANLMKLYINQIQAIVLIKSEIPIQFSINNKVRIALIRIFGTKMYFDSLDKTSFIF